VTGLNVANTFNVGYAYDFTKTDMKTYNPGTKIMTGFFPGNRYGDTYWGMHGKLRKKSEQVLEECYAFIWYTRHLTEK
jgi:hypothetical protein